jgi:hypothetical protein
VRRGRLNANLFDHCVFPSIADEQIERPVIKHFGGFVGSRETHAVEVKTGHRIPKDIFCIGLHGFVGDKVRGKI